MNIFRKILIVIFFPLLVLTGFATKINAAPINLDTDFNGVGYLTHNSAAGGNGNDYGRSVFIQADGKYVIAGYSAATIGGLNLAIWRYNPNGSLDTTFNTTGIVTHNSAAGGNGSDVVYSSVQSNGKYIMVGYSAATVGGVDMAIWRYHPDGTLDTSFNGVGYVTHNSAAGGNGGDSAQSIAIQSDGKYVIVGYSTATVGSQDMAIWRYNPDGGLDTSFNGTGYVTHANAAGGNGQDYGFSIVILNDGKYLVSGFSTATVGSYNMAIWRYHPDGTLDTSFNGVGYVTHNSAAGGNDRDVAQALVVQSDGKYIAVGYSIAVVGSNDLAVWRYNPDGTLDTTFNGTGYVTHNNAAGGNAADSAYSIAIQSDGKYVIAGYSTAVVGGGDLAIWRYNSNGSLDTTFNGTGYVTHGNAAGGNGADIGYSLTIQSNGKYMVTGSSIATVGGNDMAIWVILDYPHTDALDSIPATTNNTTITGNISAPKSTTKIGTVNWGLTNNGSWSSCSPDDGTFDSFDEDYTCDYSTLIDGTYTMYIQSCNEYGACTYTDNMTYQSFTLDTTGPTGSITIDAGATYTNSLTVNLSHSAIDGSGIGVNEMMISEDPAFAGAIWEAYSASSTFTLSAGDGVKTVYIKFRDTLNNEGPTYSDTITLDQTNPTINITDLGLIDNVPDQAYLAYYFTSQTPFIQGMTEANSIIHFEYGSNDYTTLADDTGHYEISIEGPSLPRTWVTLKYYAEDPAGNVSEERTLVLVVGVENFPVGSTEEPIATPSISITPTITITEMPQTGDITPTPILPTIVIYKVEDGSGNLLVGAIVTIDGQQYISDDKGQIYVQGSLNSDPVVTIEYNGEVLSANISGSNITAGQAISQNTNLNCLFLILLVALLVGGGYWIYKKKYRDQN